jgi:hypothetical protein
MTNIKTENKKLVIDSEGRLANVHRTAIHCIILFILTYTILDDKTNYRQLLPSAGRAHSPIFMLCTSHFVIHLIKHKKGRKKNDDNDTPDMWIQH